MIDLTAADIVAAIIAYAARARELEQAAMEALTEGRFDDYQLLVGWQDRLELARWSEARA